MKNPDLLNSTMLMVHLSECGQIENNRNVIDLLFEAEKGNIKAQLALAFMYKHGHGVTSSDEESARWYLMAANSGHPGACLIVGQMYRIGQGVQKDDDRAMEWLKRGTSNVAHRM